MAVRDAPGPFSTAITARTHSRSREISARRHSTSSIHQRKRERNRERERERERECSLLFFRRATRARDTPEQCHADILDYTGNLDNGEPGNSRNFPHFPSFPGRTRFFEFSFAGRLIGELGNFAAVGLFT